MLYEIEIGGLRMSFQHSNMRPSIPPWFWRALAFAFVGTLIVASIMVYLRVREYVAGQQIITFADSVPLVIETPEPDATAGPNTRRTMLRRARRRGRPEKQLFGQPLPRPLRDAPFAFFAPDYHIFLDCRKGKMMRISGDVVSALFDE